MAGDVSTTSTSSARSAPTTPNDHGVRHTGTYESIGFSCRGIGEPDIACDAPYPANYTDVVVGNLDDSATTSDFVWLFADFDAGSGRFLGYPVDDRRLVGLGHGVRVEPLDRAPAGLVIGGQAWIRLTVSSLSAVDHAEAHGKLVPAATGYTFEHGTEGDAPTPVSFGEPGSLSEEVWIESVTLAATNDTMSEWIIAFDQPGTYAVSAYYYQAVNHPEAYSLVVTFVPV